MFGESRIKDEADELSIHALCKWNATNF